MRSFSTRGGKAISHKAASIRRPWPALRSSRLTKPFRRQVCIHEAGHAVIRRLSGGDVFRLAVAPAGVSSWETVGSDGTPLTNAWGLASTSHSDGYGYIWWDDAKRRYRVDRDGWLRELQSREQLFGRAYGKLEAASLIAKEHRSVRADLAGFLAGPAAEAIYVGADVSRSMRRQFDTGAAANDDLVIARALARLLRHHDEFEHAAELTEQTLRRPAIWDAVVQLAAELERVGEMDDVEQWLPEPENNWPPAPDYVIASPTQRRRQ